MTLIVAVPAQDGLIVASDSQITVGSVRASGRKVFKLGAHIIWGGSGELAVIQRVAELLEGFSHRDQPLSSIRDTLSTFVKTAVTALLQNDFRTQFFQNSPTELLELHQADFLFGEYRDQRSRVLHVLSHGTSEWVEDRIAATGNGGVFAHALLHKYSGVRLNCNQAKILAYKIIEEAIQVGSWGLGPPIDIWEISAGGAVQAGPEERAGLEDSANLVRQAEIRVLSGEEAPTPEDRLSRALDQTNEQELPA